ncbi:MAG: hypothetical protein IH998_09005, partial [Proteobacteria bacterium]|nr:hypothetical protein [Pseudomonadota bacterium]
VGVHVNRRGRTGPGERVLIVGAGVVGTMTAQVARARGAAEVILVDRYETRRALLDRLGFRETGRRERTLLVGTEWCDSVDLQLNRDAFFAAQRLA